jgi:hypothetical protein
MTVQELSTVMRHDLNPFIFLINNSGYSVERAVLGKDARYNDVANWRYSELPNVFSQDKEIDAFVVNTENELQKALGSSHPGMLFVEVVMDKYDAPIDLVVGGHALADSDYGVTGPQALPRCVSTKSRGCIYTRAIGRLIHCLTRKRHSCLHAPGTGSSMGYFLSSAGGFHDGLGGFLRSGGGPTRILFPYSLKLCNRPCRILRQAFKFPTMNM